MKKIQTTLSLIFISLFIQSVYLYAENSINKTILQEFISNKRQYDLWLDNDTFLLKATGYCDLHRMTQNLVTSNAHQNAVRYALERLADVEVMHSAWPVRPKGLIDACRNGKIIYVHEKKCIVDVVYMVKMKNLKNISKKYNMIYEKKSRNPEIYGDD